MRQVGHLALLAALAGCGASDRDSGGVGTNEAQALNDAAEMLDAPVNNAAMAEGDNGNTANMAAHHKKWAPVKQ